MCLLAWGLIEQHHTHPAADKLNHSPFVFERPEDPTPVVDAGGECIRCPRCHNLTAGLERGYDVKIDQLLPVKEKMMNLRYRVWCNFCGLEIRRKFT
jgi:hypothetical protein